MESITNSAVGFLISVLMQHILMKLYGFETTVTQNVVIVTAFTVISVLRSYFLRRFFERLKS